MLIHLHWVFKNGIDNIGKKMYSMKAILFVGVFGVAGVCVSDDDEKIYKL